MSIFVSRDVSDRKRCLSLVMRILASVLFLGAAPISLAGQGFEVNLVREFGGLGNSPGQFNFPLGIIVNSQDQIIIADAGNHRIQICDHEGSCETFGGLGSAMGRFSNPHGVAVDSQDRIYVVETGNVRLQVFDSTGNWMSMFGAWGSALGQFKTPGDVAIDNQGRILVADEQNYRVQTCSVAGQCTAFGSRGTAPGEFDWPRALVVDSQDTIIVTDRFNHRVQLCDEQGSCSVFGDPGSEPGQFEGPVEVALDSQERIIIADRDNNRVQVCDRLGDCWAFGSFGSGPGEFNHPLGVAVDSQDRIIVADNGNNRIQIFEVVAPFQINPGLNGSWANFDTLGQGFFIDVLPDIPLIFFAWFTWETDQAAPARKGSEMLQAVVGDDNHRWLTAQGPFSGNTAQLDVTLTTGGLFDNPQQTTNSEPGTQGTITLTFTDCKTGTVDYEFTAIGLSGSVPIQRLAEDNVDLCNTMDGIDDPE